MNLFIFLNLIKLFKIKKRRDSGGTDTGQLYPDNFQHIIYIILVYLFITLYALGLLFWVCIVSVEHYICKLD